VCIVCGLRACAMSGTCGPTCDSCEMYKKTELERERDRQRELEAGKQTDGTDWQNWHMVQNCWQVTLDNVSCRQKRHRHNTHSHVHWRAMTDDTQTFHRSIIVEKGTSLFRKYFVLMLFSPEFSAAVVEPSNMGGFVFLTSLLLKAWRNDGWSWHGCCSVRIKRIIRMEKIRVFWRILWCERVLFFFSRKLYILLIIWPRIVDILTVGMFWNTLQSASKCYCAVLLS